MINFRLKLTSTIIFILIIAHYLVCNTNEIKIEWIKIPAGNFYMGISEEFYKNLPSKDYWKNEIPVHKVYLDSFFISKYEITYSQYNVFCKETSRRKPYYYENRLDSYPISDVSWYDAMEFCKWLSEKKKEQITLPTEAQWEKACRAGTTGDSYVHRSSKWIYGEYPEDYSPIRLLIKTAWISYNSDREVHPVGQLEPNPYGIFDMLGNVSEWCLDIYDEDYYKKSPPKNPVCLEGDKSIRIHRGGDFTCDNFQARCGARFSCGTNERVGNIGFRIVKNVKK